MKLLLLPEENLWQNWFPTKPNIENRRDLVPSIFLRIVFQSDRKEGEFIMRHLMSPLDFTVQELERLFDLAGDMEQIGRASCRERV